MSSSDAAEVGIAGLIVLLGTVLSMFAGFLFRIVLAQYTDGETFGTVILFVSLLNMVSIFSLLGLNRGIVKFTSERDGYDSKRNTYIFLAILSTVLISALCGVLVLFFSDFAKRQLFNRSVSDIFMVLFVISLPFFTLNKILGSTLRGSMNSTGYVAFSKILQPGIKLLFTFAAIIIAGSTTSIVVGIFVGFVLSSLSGFALILQKGWRPNLDTSIRFRRFYAYSFPLMIASSVFVILTNFDKMMIAYYTSPVDVGKYEAAMTTAKLMGVCSSAFSFLLFPKISSLISSGSDSEIESLYQQTTKWILLFTTPLFLVIALRPYLILSLFGENYQSKDILTALFILAIGFFIKAVLGPNSEALLGLDESWAVLGYNTCAVVVNVLLNFLLIPPFGLRGAAIASMIGYASMNLLKSADLYFRHQILSVNATALKMATVSTVTGFVFVRVLPQTASFLVEVVMLTLIVVSSIGSGLLTLHRINGIKSADRKLFQEIVSFFPI